MAGLFLSLLDIAETKYAVKRAQEKAKDEIVKDGTRSPTESV